MAKRSRGLRGRPRKGNGEIVPLGYYSALDMTAPGTKVVLPKMAALIDEAKEFERTQFQVLCAVTASTSTLGISDAAKPAVST